MGENENKPFQPHSTGFCLRRPLAEMIVPCLPDDSERGYPLVDKRISGEALGADIGRRSVSHSVTRKAGPHPTRPP